MELCQVYLNNKGVMSRRYLIKWDELNRTHHGKVWIKTSSDWRSHSKCQKHFLFYFFFSLDIILDITTILIEKYSFSGSKMLKIISCSLIDFINECFFLFRVLWESPRIKWLAFMTSKRPLVKAIMPWSSWQSMFSLEKKLRSR